MGNASSHKAQDTCTAEQPSDLLVCWLLKKRNKYPKHNQKEGSKENTIKI
jgi:hypothetical protein